MSLPPTFTWRASNRRRRPPQSGHTEYPRYRLRKTRTCSLYFFLSRWLKNPRTPRNLPSPLSTRFLCSSDRSTHGTSSGMPACFAYRFRSVKSGRYFGLVQGSIAPSASVFNLSGITKSRSKSIVFPNPWHLGQAPYGLLNEKSLGSGSSYRRLQNLHSKRCANRSLDAPPP